MCRQTLGAGESQLCLACLASLPLTGFHHDDFNPLHQRLAPEKVERAAAMFYYMRESPSARIIHLTKYESQPWIGRDVAGFYASQLNGDGFFDGMDGVIAVPMHWWKKAGRGFNQADVIARSVARVAGLPVLKKCLKARYHGTQTRKGAFQRYLNTALIYSAVSGHELDGKHVLLVDDVITTGATIHACIRALREAYPRVRVSVLALAATRMR